MYRDAAKALWKNHFSLLGVFWFAAANLASFFPSLPRSLGLSYDSRGAGSLPRLTFAILPLGRGSWEIQGWTFAAG